MINIKFLEIQNKPIKNLWRKEILSNMVRNNKNYEQKVWKINEMNNQFLEKIEQNVKIFIKLSESKRSSKF